MLCVEYSGKKERPHIVDVRGYEKVDLRSSLGVSEIPQYLKNEYRHLHPVRRYSSRLEAKRIAPAGIPISVLRGEAKKIRLAKEKERREKIFTLRSRFTDLMSGRLDDRKAPWQRPHARSKGEWEAIQNRRAFLRSLPAEAIRKIAMAIQIINRAAHNGTPGKCKALLKSKSAALALLLDAGICQKTHWHHVNGKPCVSLSVGELKFHAIASTKDMKLLPLVEAMEVCEWPTTSATEEDDAFVTLASFRLLPDGKPFEVSCPDCGENWRWDNTGYDIRTCPDCYSISIHP